MVSKHNKFKILLILVSAVLYCEIVNYYFIISWCSWPKFASDTDEKSENLLKVMLLTDTHLLGPYRGHWFDKLRREWQMHQAFQSAVYLHKPEVVFILGDLFDEGQWCNEIQFQEYLDRFSDLFRVPESTKLFVVPGNHDIGFHYAVNPYLVNRFEKAFNISSVQYLNLKGNHFILINSMALERDGCAFCRKAERKVMDLADELKCIKNKKVCKSKRMMKDSYSRPIVLQHFPMFRESDAVCNEQDEAPPLIKSEKFREKWECLSNEASEMIYRELHPRLIVNGHVHHGCHIIHKDDIHEYTLPSFSWRNKNNPSFMLAKFTPTNFVVEKCHIPKESTVIVIYICIIVSTVFCMLRSYIF